MSMHKRLAALILALSFGAGSALAQSPKLGKPISEADIKQWDIAILPDGTNLPPGSGTSAQGAKIYAEKCVACHAEGGKGGASPGAGPLAGGAPLTNGIDTLKTIGNYYAYATTVFDYTRRAMPFNMPRSLTDNEVYALTAYILSINKLIGDNDVIDAKIAAAGENAEPGQLHHSLPRSNKTLIGCREGRARFGSKANVRPPNCDVRNYPEKRNIDSKPRHVRFV